MNTIQSLKHGIEKGLLTLPELQHKLTTHLLSLEIGLETPAEINNYEKQVYSFDNAIELAIYTLESENQINAALKVLDRVEQFLKTIQHDRFTD